MKKLIPKLLDLAVEIQQIPAPTFQEAARGRFIAERFREDGLEDVHTDALGNVFGCLPGGSGPPVVVSAHLDTVFPAGTPLRIRRTSTRIFGPGIGDNSLAVAGLLGLLWALRTKKARLSGDLWLVANTGEEGLGDLRGMRAVVDRFGERPRAYLVLEGTALGQIYHRALAVRRLRITAETQGGHSWVNYGRPSAVHELARLVAALDSLPLPESPRCSLNAGTFHGGNSVNSIAAHAEIELDLRSVESETLESLDGQVRDLVASFAAGDVRITVEKIGDRPGGALPLDHWLVRLAEKCLQEAGLEAHPSIGSTDANLPLSRGLPAICIGLTRGRGAHTMGEYIETEPLALGLQQLLLLVLGVFQWE